LSGRLDKVFPKYILRRRAAASLKEKGYNMFLIKMDDKGIPEMTHFNYTVQ